jgi:hypothetical protein
MMGQADPQRTLFYQLSLETFVPAEHPLRAIRPLIDDHAIFRCRDSSPTACEWNCIEGHRAGIHTKSSVDSGPSIP